MAFPNHVDRPIPVIHSDGMTSVVLSGEIDAASVDTLERALATIPSDSARRVMVDVAAVEFLGAAGINALVAAAVRLGLSGTTLRLVDPSPLVRRVVSLLGLQELLGTIDGD